MAIVRVVQPTMDTDMDAGTSATTIRMDASSVEMIAAENGKAQIIMTII